MSQKNNLSAQTTAQHQGAIPEDMQQKKIQNPTNKSNANSGNRNTDLIVSKPMFAAAVQAKLPNLNEEVNIRHGTHLGKPAVYFSVEDYFVKLAQECILTLIGKFYKGKPSMDEIRKVQFHLIGLVKIAFFDHRHVYIDFSNEVDYNHVLFKEFVDIGESPMKILKWTTDFNPEKEISIVPGVEIAPDQANYSKSRGNVAKVKVEIDLLKPKLDPIWLSFKRPDGFEDARDERIKMQKEKQNNKEKEARLEKDKVDDDGFQTVNKKKRSNGKRIYKQQEKIVQSNGAQMENDSQYPNQNKGIIIKEPAKNNKLPTLVHILGKEKDIVNTSTREDQAQMDSHGGTELAITSNEKNTDQSQDKNRKQDIESNEVHNNYLKLISGTILDKFQLIPFEDEDRSDDSDYVEQEESSDSSGEYASLEREETTSDEHAENLTEFFSPNTLVDVGVSSTFDNAIKSGHLSPRGRE
ncbi:hypothetical protein BC332_11158 [Capsicum chinense]|nr:hypothetical protein BC332_11158 [Capsicum chinense]